MNLYNKRQPGDNAPVQTTASAPVAKTSHPASTISLKGSALAGIIVGTLILGLLLAILGAWVFQMLRKDHGHRRRSKGHVHLAAEPRRTGVMGGFGNIEDYLAIPAAESEIKNAVQSLAGVIENHVDNFYHADPVDGKQSRLIEAIQKCGYHKDQGAKIAPEDILTLMRLPSSRLIAIRHLIGQVVLGSISWNTQVERALLPQHIVMFYHDIPSSETKPGCADELTQAFIKWRHLSAYLLSTWRTNREALKPNNKSLEPAIAYNISLINDVVGSFMELESETRQKQEENLRGILLDAAELGSLLFGQPTMWSFDWTLRRSVVQTGRAKSQIVRKEMVVFPALGEESPRNGSTSWRTVLEPEIVDI